MANQFIKEITLENFQTEAIEAELPVLLDFWATWCGPCRMIAPAIEAIAEAYDGKLIVGKVDVDENAALAQQYGVMSIPTLVVLKDGQMVAREVGARGQDAIVEMIAPYLEA